MSCCCWGHSPSRRSTGNDISGHYFRHYFLLPFSFSPSPTFLIEGVLGSKNRSAKKTRGTRPCQPFWGPLMAILNHGGSEYVPPAPLGWYSNFNAPLPWHQLDGKVLKIDKVLLLKTQYQSLTS